MGRYFIAIEWMRWVLMAHIIAGVALVYLFERRIQLGAILVDWSGVYTNRLWTHTFIPWEHMTTPGVSQVHPMPVMNQTLEEMGVGCTKRCPAQYS